MILLSEGEADPLVVKEALIAGLGVVVSECSAANLDLSKQFITIIPNDKIKCSRCNSKLSNIPLGCIFNKCKWKYEGIVMKNGDTEFVTSDWKVTETHRFQELNNQWVELTLHTLNV